jgi:hypothetical protein
MTAVSAGRVATYGFGVAVASGGSLAHRRGSCSHRAPGWLSAASAARADLVRWSGATRSRLRGVGRSGLGRRRSGLGRRRSGLGRRRSGLRKRRQLGHHHARQNDCCPNRANRCESLEQEWARRRSQRQPAHPARRQRRGGDSWTKAISSSSVPPRAGQGGKVRRSQQGSERAHAGIDGGHAAFGPAPTPPVDSPSRLRSEYG